MRFFRLRFADNTTSVWLNLEEYTIKQFIQMSILWLIKFKDYQMEFREV